MTRIVLSVWVLILLKSHEVLIKGRFKLFHGFGSVAGQAGKKTFPVIFPIIKAFNLEGNQTFAIHPALADRCIVFQGVLDTGVMGPIGFIDR